MTLIPDRRPISREEFHNRFQGPMLLALVEAWEARRCDRAKLADLIELHAISLKKLRDEMYDALNPRPVPDKPAEQPPRK